MWAARAVFAWLLALSASVARGAVPQQLLDARSVVTRSAWPALERFFATGGASDYWRVAVDRRCVDGPQRVQAPRHTRADYLDSKWSLDISLPRMLAQSRWGVDRGGGGPAPNATLVEFSARSSPRHLLSVCRRLADDLQNAWFISSTDRGWCCDGGQLRDPALLAHNFFVLRGEPRSGDWLFRESVANKGGHAWRAPVTRNTAPKVRCFDDKFDVALPPPARLVTRDALGDEPRRDAQASNVTRPFLVMHAEGGQGPPEYALRRLLTERWAADWPRRFVASSAEPAHLIRKKMSAEEHSAAMFTSKFCLVVEGFAPWTPRLSEAISAGCVPAILSPSYRPPFAGVLDWRKFAAFVRPGDVDDLLNVLGRLDHATLHANLLKVRPLFRFCVDEGACVPDALPLVVFEMARRKAPRSKRPTALTGTVAALTGESAAPDYKRQRVDYACADGAKSCVYAVDGQHYNCSAVTNMACGCRKVPPPEGPRLDDRKRQRSKND